MALAGPANRSGLRVTGGGNSASLSITGSVALSGVFATGALVVGSAAIPGALNLQAGGTLTAASLAFGAAGGQLGISGAATLYASGSLNLVGTAGAPATLSLTKSSYAKLGSLVLDGGTIALDGGSQIEIGSTGVPAGSALTVDAGATVASAGGLITANVAMRGTLLANAGKTTLLGTVSGSGRLQIGGGATLSLGGSVAAKVVAAFAAATGTLQLGLAAGKFAGSISGFVQGDAIDLVGQVFTDAALAAGTLTLANDGVAGLSLHLTGSYVGMVFLAVQDGAGGTLVTLAPGTPGAGGAPASAGTAAPDAYSWIAGGGGDWGNAGNWADLSTAGSPASVPPGIHDAVSIATAGPGFQLLTGQGNAASLALGGNLALSGQVAAGSLTIGAPGGGGVADIIAGGSVAAATATLLSGTLLLDGSGAALTVTGQLAIAAGIGDATTAAVFNGAALHAGGLALGGGTIAVDPAGLFEVGSAGTATPGVLCIDPGATLASSGGIIAAPVVANGTLLLAAGTTTLLRSLSGSGVAVIDPGAMLILSGAGAFGAGTVSFAAGGGTLRLGSGSGFTGRVSGFAVGAVIDLADTLVTDVGYSAGTLSLGNAGLATMTLSLPGSFDPTGFLIASDGAGGSAITLTSNAPCFAAGTRIRTAGGDVAVEALRAGDHVVTLSGRGAPLKRVVWIGWRRVDLSRHPHPADVAPIRIAAGALAPGMPQRDLLLSPDHAVFVAGAGPPGAVGGLVPVRYLANGASIRREPARGHVLYFHVELSGHDLLLAEGLPVESYLDTGNRDGFANAGVPIRLHMDMGGATGPDPERALRIWRERACGPLVTAGPGLADARARLLERTAHLGWHRLDDPGLCLHAAGARIRPTRDADSYRFILPGGTRRLRLASRHVVPAEIMPDNPDHRRLGVAVTGLRLDGASLPLDARVCGAGWHAPEAGLRWTDGGAMLTLPPAAEGRVLTVTLRPLLRYWRRFSEARHAGQLSPLRRAASLGA